MEVIPGKRVRAEKYLASANIGAEGVVYRVWGEAFYVRWDNGSEDRYNETYLEKGYLSYVEDWVLLTSSAAKKGLRVKRSGKDAVYDIHEGDMGTIVSMDTCIKTRWDKALEVTSNYEIEDGKLMYQLRASNQTATNNTIHNDDIIKLARTSASIKRGEIPEGASCSARTQPITITVQSLSHQAVARK